MKKERFKRRIRKITAFSAAAAMAVSVMFPGEAFGNIDFGITVFAEDDGYVNGFCTEYEQTGACTNPNHTNFNGAHECNGYQRATDDNNDGVFEIGNAGQLYWFADMIIKKGAVSAGAILTDDITVNENVLTANGELNPNLTNPRSWTPIGYPVYSYKGTFDGQGHKISGLYFKDEKETYIGLFEHIDKVGKVINVGIVDNYFSANYYVGGICGQNDGTIENCYNAGTVKASFGSTDYLGGISGSNEGGSIIGCFNTGNVSGSSCYIGGICGASGIYQEISGSMIKNCYNAGKISTNDNVNGYIGGLCGQCWQSTLENCYNTGILNAPYSYPLSGGWLIPDTVFKNCYYLDNINGYNGNEGVKKTSAAFSSGEVCRLVGYHSYMNGKCTLCGNVQLTNVSITISEPKSAENLATTASVSTTGVAAAPTISWQPADTSAAYNTAYTASVTLSASTGYVFADSVSVSVNDTAVDSSDITYNDNGTITVVYTFGATDEKKILTSSDFTFAAPTELVYSGSAKTASVTTALEGVGDITIKYYYKSGTELSSAPVNAETYTVKIDVTEGDDYQAISDLTAESWEFTIDKADPVGERNHDINVVVEEGTFTEPAFTGIDGQPLKGDVSYSLYEITYTYNEMVEKLKTKYVSSFDINYKFTPNNINYNNVTGKITFYFHHVAFKVGDETATAANAVTVKANPTYGDTWAEILTLNTGLKAVLEINNVISDTEVTTGFSLDVTGSPDVGNDQEYKVLFNGTIGGKTFIDHVVATGTIDISQKELTVTAGDFKVSKEYDGTTNKGASSGELEISGLVGTDTVTITPTIGAYSSADVGASNVTVTISLTDASGNYTLGNTTVSVPAEITPMSITPTVEVTGTYTYTGSAITPTFTVKDGETVLVKDTDYTVTLSDNINAGTGKITIKPVSGSNYTFVETTENFTIGKGTPNVTAPTASTQIEYGKTLADTGLTEGWTWENEDTVPDVDNTGYTAYKIVTDYENYDYSNLAGFDYDEAAHKLSCNVFVTVVPTTPKITITANLPSVVTEEDTTVTVSAEVKNPNNDSLDDLPAPELSYIIGTSGAEIPIENGSFVIPAGTPKGTYITIKAKTTATANYDQGTATKTILFGCAHTSLTKVPAKSATCTTDGNSEYWYCDTCGKYFSDASGTTELSDIPVIQKKGHNWSAAWETDENYHWHKCLNAGCTIKSGKARHYSNAAATEDSPEVCRDCGYEMNPALGHTHNLATKYSSDETGHWYACSDCDEKVDFEKHTEDSGTVTADGKVFRCIKCGWVIRTEAVQEIEKPVITKCFAGVNMVGLNWTSVEGAESYRVYYWADGKWTYAGSRTVNGMYVRNLTAGKKYGFAVKAVAGGKVSEVVSADIRYATPMAALTETVKPAITKAFAAGNGTVGLNWTLIEGVSNYKVYYWADGKWTYAGSRTVNGMYVRNLTAGKSYGFAVKAYVNGKYTDVVSKDIVYVTVK